MKTLRLMTAALTLGAFVLAPVFAQDDAGRQGGTQRGGMQGDMMGGGMMGGMHGMSLMDQYRMRWAFYNLDEWSMRRYQAMGVDERTVQGAANIAMRAGLDLDYVLRRLQISGLPLAQFAVQQGLPAGVVTEEIQGMGGMMDGGMMGGVGGQRGGTTGVGGDRR